MNKSKCSGEVLGFGLRVERHQSSRIPLFPLPGNSWRKVFFLYIL